MTEAHCAVCSLSLAASFSAASLSTMVSDIPQISSFTFRKTTDLLIPPSNQLEKLYRDRLGQHSIRINDQWRVCFRWQDGEAYEVGIVDYH